MAITGYRKDGYPMFDNPQEFCEFEEQRKIGEYLIRNRHDIMRDIDLTLLGMRKMTVLIQCGLSNMEELKDEFLELGKEFEMLDKVLPKFEK